ncbi:MAG TPA: TonB-dependent receptor, partial [Longimicrobiaceae bacterium]|nr:TonB-dependent receptor [Longimicrobiaceae bacterium]
TSGEGHMMAIRLPMSTKPMYLYLEDGVPTRSTGFFNHNALYEVNLPQAGRIEVLKGPSSTALYGSDAIGGVVNVETRDPSLLPSANAYAEAGAYGWGRVLLSASDTWGDNGVRADLNLTRTDGWREGTNYNRQSATVRWDRDLGDAALKTVLTASRVEQQTAGSSQLLRDDYLTAPTENYTPISYRSVKAVRFSTAYEREMGATLLSVTPYLRYNDMELLPNWSLTYDPTVYSTGHSSVGMLAKVRQDLPAIATRIIAGVDVDYSPGGRLEHSIDPVREANIFTDYSLGEVLYDYDVTYHAVSPYIQAEANPTDRLYLSAGVRYDRMGYDYDSHLQPLQEGSHRRPADTEISYDHLSPKVGATLDLGRGLNFYGNYSHGFRVPSEGQIFQQGSAENTVGLEPVLANSVELGMRGELGGRFGYSLALYRMVVENDILTYIRPDGLRENQNAGETLHQGFEMGLGAVLTESLRADLSYSYAQHTYEEWTPRPEVDYGGNEQEGAPNILASTRLTYTPSFVPDGEISIAWRHLGGYWMDPTNLHEYPGHDIVDLSLEMPVTPEVELIGRAMNLTNEHYAETASFNEFRGEEFAPGMPRTLYLGVQYRWLGDKQ